MTETILCLVAFAMLCWVLLLDSRVRHLQKENKALRETVRRQMEDLKKGVDASGGKRLVVERSSPPEPPRAKAGSRRNRPSARA